MKKGKVLKMFLIIVGALILSYGTAYVASEDVRYLSRAGMEETWILTHRRPIDKMVRDEKVDPGTRGYLRLVLDARNFAADLGLEAKDTYTMYTDVGRDTLLLVLSASPRNCLCPYTWKYPIVGRIPYKGFFDTGMARRTADRMERQGYDVYLRPSAAFSTLGWFNDPLLSTAMSRDSMELVALVLHEIAHNTLWVKSAIPFNESYAQLVGYRGAEAFFRQRGDTTNAGRAAGRWLDEVLLGGFYTRLADRLDSLYRAAPDSAAVDSGRAEAGAWARDRLQELAPEFRTYRIGPMSARPVNNARIIAARIYRSHLDLFEEWYQQHGARVDSSVAALKRLMEGVEGEEAFQKMGEKMGE